MFKHSTIALAISSCFLVSGCLEVENNSNDDLVAAIENQNNNTAEAMQTATLTGSIKHLLTNDTVENAQISIKIGNTWSEITDTTNGLFELLDLPAAADFTLLVSSADNSFQERAFYGNTSYGIRQLGALLVADSELIEFEVLQSGTNEPVPGLEFNYSISTSLESYYDWQERNEHFIRSTYNEQTGMYSIAKIAGFNKELVIDFDIDNDAIDDYSLTQQPSDVNRIYTDELSNGSGIYVVKTAENAEFSVRLSIIDTLGNTINDLNVAAYTQLSKPITPTFDSSSNEYVFEYKGTASMSLVLPSYVDSEGTNYTSNKITLTAFNDGVSVQGNYNNNLNGFYPLENGVFSLVSQLKESNSNPQLRIINADIDTKTQGYYVFMDTPVKLVEDSIKLVSLEQINVTRGNDSDADFVEPGVTQITVGDVELPIKTALTFNDSFITSLPTTVLPSGRYQYRFTSAIEKDTDLIKYFSTQTNFTVEHPEKFNISQIKLDNNNGKTNDNLIVSANTAGIAPINPYQSNNANVYLPSSITTLESLKFYLISYTSNGTSNPLNYTISAVNDGNINATLRYTVSSALNERVETESYRIDKYTNLADSKWYALDFSYNISNLDDNTASNKNDMTLGYEYVIKGSNEVITGKITLPVL
ncbi:hypothetical protein [Pseudoalteromonas sp.]|uniref:hypothetical protein n=1 Tax=Pseudoalteromonas sp. TaxID=53249 RepID=UPI003002FE91